MAGHFRKEVQRRGPSEGHGDRRVTLGRESEREHVCVCVCVCVCACVWTSVLYSFGHCCSVTGGQASGLGMNATRSRTWDWFSC